MLVAHGSHQEQSLVRPETLRKNIIFHFSCILIDGKAHTHTCIQNIINKHASAFTRTSPAEPDPLDSATGSFFTCGLGAGATFAGVTDASVPDAGVADAGGSAEAVGCCAFSGTADASACAGATGAGVEGFASAGAVEAFAFAEAVGACAVPVGSVGGTALARAGVGTG